MHRNLIYQVAVYFFLLFPKTSALKNNPSLLKQSVCPRKNSLWKLFFLNTAAKCMSGFVIKSISEKNSNTISKTMPIETILMSPYLHGDMMHTPLPLTPFPR